jgi:hypothetical protein
MSLLLTGHAKSNHPPITFAVRDTHTPLVTIRHWSLLALPLLLTLRHHQQHSCKGSPCACLEQQPSPPPPCATTCRVTRCVCRRLVVYGGGVGATAAGSSPGGPLPAAGSTHTRSIRTLGVCKCVCVCVCATPHLQAAGRAQGQSVPSRFTAQGHTSTMQLQGPNPGMCHKNTDKHLQLCSRLQPVVRAPNSSHSYPIAHFTSPMLHTLTRVAAAALLLARPSYGPRPPLLHAPS